jgi:hypothetical protein
MPASILKSLIVGTDAILALDGTCRLPDISMTCFVEMKYITSMIELQGDNEFRFLTYG